MLINHMRSLGNPNTSLASVKKLDLVCLHMHELLSLDLSKRNCGKPPSTNEPKQIKLVTSDLLQQ
mgnify:CR=1 FL=1